MLIRKAKYAPCGTPKGAKEKHDKEKNRQIDEGRIGSIRGISTNQTV